MTVTEGRARQDRRPEWMRHKHAGTSPADAEVREVFAGLVRQAHAAGTPLRVSDLTGITYDDEEEARDDGRLLYDAGKRLSVAVSAWPTDPATGKCKHCDGWPGDGATCRPSPRGVSDLHFRAFDKTAARRHVVDTYGDDPELWPYTPGGTRHAGNGQQEPQRAFGADRIPAGEDQPPDRSGFRRPPKPPAANKPAAKPATTADAESFAEKLRRWTS